MATWQVQGGFLFLLSPEAGHKTFIGEVPSYTWMAGASLSAKTEGH